MALLAYIPALLSGIFGFLMVRRGLIVAMVAAVGLWVTGIQASIEEHLWNQMNSLSPEFYSILDLLGVPEVITIFFFSMSFAFHWWAYRKAMGLI